MLKHIYIFIKYKHIKTILRGYINIDLYYKALN